MKQRTFLFIALLIFVSGLTAQEGIKYDSLAVINYDSLEVMDYEHPKEYVIADIQISGIEFIQKEDKKLLI